MPPSAKIAPTEHVGLQRGVGLHEIGRHEEARDDTGTNNCDWHAPDVGQARLQRARNDGPTRSTNVSILTCTTIQLLATPHAAQRRAISRARQDGTGMTEAVALDMPSSSKIARQRASVAWRCWAAATLESFA